MEKIDMASPTTTFLDLVNESHDVEESISKLRQRLVSLADAIVGPAPTGGKEEEAAPVPMCFMDSVGQSHAASRAHISELDEHLTRIERVVLPPVPDHISDAIAHAGRMVGAERAIVATAQPPKG
jgi:hypothetical protein